MLKYLSRMRRKKGFTLIELVVVIAIITVLIAVLMANAIGGNSDKQIAAAANAESFFSAAQLAMTKISLTERPIVEYIGTESNANLIEYKDGVQTTNNKYLFVEVKSTANGLVRTHIDENINKLMSDTNDDFMTPLDEFLNDLLSQYIGQGYDGYFYFVADNNFKVLCTHFSEYPFQECTQIGEGYRDKIAFSDGGKMKVTKPGAVDFAYVGTCSDSFIFGEPDTYAFCAPGPSDDGALRALYFGNM